MTGNASVDRLLRLAAIPEFSALLPAEIASLARCLESWTPEAGGQETQAHLLCAGSVVLEGRHIEAPAMLGVIETLAGSQGPLDLLPSEEAELASIGRESLLRVMADVFEIWLAILRHVAERLLEADAGLEEAAEPGAAARVDPTSLVTRIQCLRSHPFFQSLSVHALGRLSLSAQEECIPDATSLWDRGDPAVGGVIVLSGAFSSADRPEAGRLYGPGSVLGLRGALAATSHLEGFVAREESRVLRLDVESLIDEFEDDPETAQRFLEALSRIALESGGGVARAAEGP